MAAPAIPQYVTLDAFYDMPDLPKGAELVDGVVRLVTPPQFDHSWIARVMFLALHEYVSSRHLGECYPDGTGYELPVPDRPDTFRVPDASFIRAERVPRPRRWNRAMALAPGTLVRLLRNGDTLDGAPVLPGFTLALSTLFGELDAAD